MSRLEKAVAALRHSSRLESAHGLWNAVRPVYNRVLIRTYRKGLKRNINGTDALRVSVRARAVVEGYEPQVWSSLMEELKPGDVVADVGAFIGLYSIALARRVGSAGRVIAFEPDATNYSILKEHARLNGVRTVLEPVRAVVGTLDGRIAFESNGIESHAVDAPTDKSTFVPAVSLDCALDGKHLDILKIDVEGFEEKVLQGAKELLQDPARCPRAIYIEVHPYAWPQTGASSESLLSILGECGYKVVSLDGQDVSEIKEYGEIIARRAGDRR